ncbi:hypothetical protein BDQ17DRAFT_1429464 [Cyathus striatus]|nr:hypothetical protein BDQ17DRAFT_1429464 [Cyathus striatus]
MVDWKDPTNVSLQSFGLVKLVHFSAGVFVWEYFSTIYYEFQIYTGRRNFTWISMVYVACRLSMFAAIITLLVGFDLVGEYYCDAWIKCVLVFSYLGFIFATGLLVLRTNGLWNRSLPIVFITVPAYMINIGFLLHGIKIAKARWNPELQSCEALDTVRNRTNVTVTFGTDFVLLTLMAMGVYRMKIPGRLWRMLCRQSIIWILAGTLGQLPAVVLLSLNLNDSMNLMFQTPALVVMTICASRMYRDLNEFASPIQTARTTSPLEIGFPTFAAGPTSDDSDTNLTQQLERDVTKHGQ